VRGLSVDFAESFLALANVKMAKIKLTGKKFYMGLTEIGQIHKNI
jgi:hypothetical protein